MKLFPLQSHRKSPINISCCSDLRQIQRTCQIIQRISSLILGMAFLIPIVFGAVIPMANFRNFFTEISLTFKNTEAIFFITFGVVLLFVGILGINFSSLKVIYKFLVATLDLIVFVIVLLGVTLMCIQFQELQNGTIVNQTALSDSFANRTEGVTMELWNKMELMLSCCGVKGPKDYETHRYNLSLSCCSQLSGHNLTHCPLEYANKEGCFSSMESEFKNETTLEVVVITICAAGLLFGALSSLINACFEFVEKKNLGYKVLDESQSRLEEKAHVNVHPGPKYGATNGNDVFCNAESSNGTDEDNCTVHVSVDAGSSKHINICKENDEEILVDISPYNKFEGKESCQANMTNQVDETEKNMTGVEKCKSKVSMLPMSTAKEAEESHFEISTLSEKEFLTGTESQSDQNSKTSENDQNSEIGDKVCITITLKKDV